MHNALMTEAHPCTVLEPILAQHGTNLIFTYSRYEIAPPGLQAVAPRSPVLRVPAGDVTVNWIADRFAELGPRQEMAWHSRVECRGIDFHIPMIDFVGRPDRLELCHVSRTLSMEMSLGNNLVLFDTGRSFHGYFPELIPEQAWPKYLGQLLILNEHDRSPIIDTRWVGHALMRGFAALRWSHNTDRYEAMPTLSSVLNPAQT